jgi:hypothetical protein
LAVTLMAAYRTFTGPATFKVGNVDSEDDEDEVRTKTTAELRTKSLELLAERAEDDDE